MSHPFVPRVGMRYEGWEPAGTVDVPGKGEFPRQFAPGAFDSSIGKIVPFKFGDVRVGHVRVIAADVAEDGSGVQFTYEITDLDRE